MANSIVTAMIKLNRLSDDISYEVYVTVAKIETTLTERKHIHISLLRFSAT
jgi:hypothetical protein